MKRWRGSILLGGLAVLLVLAVWIGSAMPAEEQGIPAEGGAPPAEVLLDAVFDRIGVTQWAEAIQWYEWETDGMLGGEPDADRPVWIARNGMGAYHSVPLCSNMRSPVSMPLSQALAEGRAACSRCWKQAAE